MKAPHIYFFDRLEHLAHGAINPLRIQEKPLIHDHELVQEIHHEHILTFLKDFAHKHPHVAKNMAQTLLSVCERILRSENSKEHHRDALALKEKIHAQIMTILKEKSFANSNQVATSNNSLNYIDFALAEEEGRFQEYEIQDWVQLKIQNLREGNSIKTPIGINDNKAIAA